MEKKEKNKLEIKEKVSGEVWQKALKDSFEKNKKSIKLAGFRPGKVPYDVYVKKNGVESLYFDAIELVINEAYQNAITKNNIEPAAMPSYDIEKISDKEVEFKFVIVTKPEVKIKKYKDLKIVKDELVVSDDEIKNEIDHLLEHYAELIVKDGKVENGDTVIIDYSGSVDGKIFDGGSAENYSLVIGSNTFIPGFEEQLIGMEKEETKDINVKFPEDYHAENLKGKDAVFKVKVHEIKTKKQRELDEEFFEDLGIDGVNSEETLKNHVKEHIETHKKNDIENKFVEDLMAEISKNTDVEIPDEMVKDEVDRLIERAEENLKYQGISLDMYYQFTKSNEETLRNSLEPEAFKNVMNRLIFEEIKKLENISVTDKEVDEELEKMAKEYNKTVLELEKEIGNKNALKSELEARKTFERLEELNK